MNYGDQVHVTIQAGWHAKLTVTNFPSRRGSSISSFNLSPNTKLQYERTTKNHEEKLLNKARYPPPWLPLQDINGQKLLLPEECEQQGTKTVRENKPSGIKKLFWGASRWARHRQSAHGKMQSRWHAPMYQQSGTTRKQHGAMSKRLKSSILRDLTTPPPQILPNKHFKETKKTKQLK